MISNQSLVSLIYFPYQKSQQFLGSPSSTTESSCLHCCSSDTWWASWQSEIIHLSGGGREWCFFTGILISPLWRKRNALIDRKPTDIYGEKELHRGGQKSVLTAESMKLTFNICPQFAGLNKIVPIGLESQKTLNHLLIFMVSS